MSGKIPGHWSQLVRFGVVGVAWTAVDVAAVFAAEPELPQSAAVQSTTVTRFTSANASSPAVVTPEGTINVLISRLGESDYAVRRQAARKLQALGNLAIDQLLLAQHAENTEVRLTVQQLLSRLPINWLRPTDPPTIRMLMQDYAAQSDQVRAFRADWLAQLEDGMGLDALARIVRYDRSDSVSQAAAISVLQHIDRHMVSQSDAWGRAIESTLGASRRLGAEWWRAGFQDLTVAAKADSKSDAGDGDVSAAANPPSRWLPIIRSLHTGKLQGRVEREHVLRLAYWAAEQHVLRRLPEKNVRAAIEQLIACTNESPDELMSLCHWMLDHQQDALLNELVLQPELAAMDRALRNAQQDDRDEDAELLLPGVSSELAQLPRRVTLLYCQAELLRRQGQPEAAERTAERAAKLTADHQDLHVLLKMKLQTQLGRMLELRGLADWALREYTAVVGEDTPGMLGAKWKQEEAANQMAELLHDLGRDREAAEALANTLEGEQPIQLFEEEPDLPRSEQLARMYYLKSEHFRQQADWKRQSELLEKAFVADSNDADVLIGLYRLAGASPKHRAETQARIRAAVDHFETEIAELRAEGDILRFGRLATAMNQVAWLIANTEGNYQQAIEYARESLQLRPGSAGTLDTLGRAYFAAGDLENALRYQRRAVRLNPHVNQLRRQLQHFERAAQDKQAAAG